VSSVVTYASAFATGAGGFVGADEARHRKAVLRRQRRVRGQSLQYVSTRGEAPTLGFIDVTLAGLARDGGLYVPQSWPRLSAETIAGFAGRPYAEVAVEVIRPFTGDQITVSDLSRIAREAYGTFRHPAVAPISQFGANTFLLELFHDRGDPSREIDRLAAIR
jgi:hypothetical protein